MSRRLVLLVIVRVDIVRIGAGWMLGPVVVVEVMGLMLLESFAEEMVVLVVVVLVMVVQGGVVGISAAAVVGRPVRGANVHRFLG